MGEGIFFEIAAPGDESKLRSLKACLVDFKPVSKDHGEVPGMRTTYLWSIPSIGRCTGHGSRFERGFCRPTQVVT